MTQSSTVLQFGQHHSIQILVIEPLFEEANRCRRMIAQMMRALDSAGVGSTIADLPGCGESEFSIESVTYSSLRASAAKAASARAYQAVASFRGGALLEAQNMLPVWRFAPESGARIARDLERTRLAGTSDLYAGHRLSEQFLADLRAATLPPQTNLRTVRLDTDAAESDAKVAGSPLWRRAEPGEDQAFSEALAADIARWLQDA